MTSRSVVKWWLIGLALLLAVGLVVVSEVDDQEEAMGQVFMIDAAEMPEVLKAARQGDVESMLRLTHHHERMASMSQGSSLKESFIFGNHIEERRARYWALRAVEAGDSRMASNFASAYRSMAMDAHRSPDERKRYAIASLRYMLMADPCNDESPAICAIYLRDGRMMLDVIEATD